jgi:phage shock protein A
MSLFTRVSTLLRADAHGVVDELEDKTLLLRQHLREAGDELARKRAYLEELQAEVERLQEERQGLERRCVDLDGDISLALQEGKGELARFAIRKLLPIRRSGEEIESRLQALARERSDLEAKLEEQVKRYADLERQVRGHLARLEEQERGRPGIADWGVSEEEVELELLRRQQAGGEA